MIRTGNPTVTHLESARNKRRAESDRGVEAADESGLHAAFVTYGGELFGFARRSLGDNGLAEEAVQETFMRAWRSRHRFDPSLGSLRSWLFAIERRAVIDLAHKRSSNETDQLMQDPAAVDGQAEQAMLGWQVEEALRRLRPDHRAVVQDIYFRNLPGREVAARLGVPEGTVRSRLFYALEVSSARTRGDGVGAMNTLSCEKARGQVALASIGRLPESERLSLESHLDGCEECCDELESLSRLEPAARRCRSGACRRGPRGARIASIRSARVARHRGRPTPPVDPDAVRGRCGRRVARPRRRGRRDRGRGWIVTLPVLSHIRPDRPRRRASPRTAHGQVVGDFRRAQSIG